MFTEAFWLDCLANLIATVVGIGLGLPIAFWLDRKSRERGEKEKAIEIRQQAQKILSILLAELSDNVDAMDKLHIDVSNYYYPVQMESWRAFSDGGELKWIQDPAVLHNLSLAYAHMKNYSFVLDKYYDSYMFLVRTGNQLMTKHNFESVMRFRDAAKASAIAASDYLRTQLDDITK